MRIGQAIDNVYQNNKLEYQSETLKIYFDPLNQTIRIRDLTDGGFHIVLSDDFKNEKFKLIQKPVSFMDVVKSGKKFTVGNVYLTVEEKRNICTLESFIYSLRTFDNEQLQSILTEGKFYIQEED